MAANKIEKPALAECRAAVEGFREEVRGNPGTAPEDYDFVARAERLADACRTVYSATPRSPDVRVFIEAETRLRVILADAQAETMFVDHPDGPDITGAITEIMAMCAKLDVALVTLGLGTDGVPEATARPTHKEREKSENRRRIRELEDGPGDWATASNAAVASKLGLSEKTVQTHRQALKAAKR